MFSELDKLLARDAALCATMADELEDYLRSNVLFWEPNRRAPGGADLPKLTIGGLLLALRRLQTLRDRLASTQLEALDQAERALAFQKSEWRFRYQSKLTRDLRSRLDSWAWYLEDCCRGGESIIAHYPRQVETRVKIELLLAEADEVGLDVQGARQRQTDLDRRLRADFALGDFCWLDELAPGFPAERFWYVWGRPECQ